MQLAFCGVCLSKLAAIKDALGREGKEKNALFAAYRLETWSFQNANRGSVTAGNRCSTASPVIMDSLAEWVK